MTQYVLKILITAALVVVVSEASKRSTLLGGVFASLPLVSFLAMLWLYHDTKDAGKVAALSSSIFWLVLPSLVFFLALPALVKMKVNFHLGFGLAAVLMLASYGAMVWLLKKCGVNL
jgi:F0F1-type ATP synthase assembly protein I